MPTSLRRTSTPEEAASVLERRILEGDLPPGTWLREVELAGELGVSRNTLRQALQSLVRAGLLEHHPHRGVRVAVLDEDDVTDLLRVRRGLEDAALARCADPDRLGARLAAITAKMEAAGAAAAWTRVADLDLRFHAEIVATLGSERVGRFFADVYRELRLAFILIDQDEARGAERLPHVPDHHRIADAVRHGDLDDARVRLRRHLDEAERRLRAFLAG